MRKMKTILYIVRFILNIPNFLVSNKHTHYSEYGLNPPHLPGMLHDYHELLFLVHSANYPFRHQSIVHKKSTKDITMVTLFIHIKLIKVFAFRSGCRRCQQNVHSTFGTTQTLIPNTNNDTSTLFSSKLYQYL